MSGLRVAIIRGGAVSQGLERVRAYMPSNYNAIVVGDDIEIRGHDNAGWTLDGFVLPRLASGLIFAEEVAS